ncbi:FMN reductase [Saccharopolyspora erythraea NRRL 2338]|uniref:NADPH-dependent FMN reductase n=2 Tax=Saccharopolyspora erythraea TaxID=1836 RepID=A0ABN1CB06_SACER|nr:NADPH-dependent FMN reductase [Saccharopolyspora erythraea]EQD85603.1 NADPH-dependent FMN reductase [Saccharopolyspora erythraea D]PFG96943.1 FMN reductase [Saccharopolyspora erythraea NRRL 2338]QRK87165.1 NADPH-dependent FMN reductase [Saccharopolyspora erythraea]CAM03239.1 probable NADPH-dependent fmn reductase oxidoreductase protein [Saccharopolyspora erythraea NRRL 2338]
MSNVLIISGSPSATSKTERVGDHLARRLAGEGIATEHLRLRRLPPRPLLSADAADPDVAAAVAQVERADGIILATPTYKAAYSGLLKVFLDLLPQFGFAGKAVLPLATGGSVAHVLALDYGLRPVVQSLGPRHVVQSFFLLDKHILGLDEDLSLHADSAAPLEDVLAQFRKALDGVPHETVLGRSA